MRLYYIIKIAACVVYFGDASKSMKKTIKIRSQYE